MSKKYKVILIGWVCNSAFKIKVICKMYPKSREEDEVWIGLNNDSWLRRKKVNHL